MYACASAHSGPDSMRQKPPAGVTPELSLVLPASIKVDPVNDPIIVFLGIVRRTVLGEGGGRRDLIQGSLMIQSEEADHGDIMKVLPSRWRCVWLIAAPSFDPYWGSRYGLLQSK